MKKIHYLGVFLLLYFLGNFSNETMAQSRSEVVSIARKAAAAAAKEIMSDVSPNTGQDPDYELDYESIVYDSYEKEIECRVQLSWTAKKYMLSSTRRTCETWGKLYIDLSNGSSRIKTRYVSKGNNSWFNECASSHWIDRVAAGVAFIVVN